MSQSFSNHQFSNLPDDLADIAAGILSRVQEFERRLGPAHDPSDPKAGQPDHRHFQRNVLI